jgi:hypothetical protein
MRARSRWFSINCVFEEWRKLNSKEQWKPFIQPSACTQSRTMAQTVFVYPRQKAKQSHCDRQIPALRKSADDMWSHKVDLGKDSTFNSSKMVSQES